MADDQDRPKRALIVSLKLENGGCVVSLDDAVENDHGGCWKQDTHVTSKTVPEDFLSLPEDELASFGYYILARLSAYRNLGEL